MTPADLLPFPGPVDPPRLYVPPDDPDPDEPDPAPGPVVLRCLPLPPVCVCPLRVLGWARAAG